MRKPNSKSNLLFSLALLALAILFWLPFRGISRLFESDRWISHTREVLQTSADLREHLASSVAARRSYILYGEPKLLDVFALKSRQTLESYAALRRLTADDPEQQKKLRELEPVLQRRLTLLKQAMEFHEKWGDDREEEAKSREQGALAGEEIEKLIRQFEDTERALFAERTAATAQAVRWNNWMSIAFTVAVFSTLLLAMRAINREHAARARAERALAGSEKVFESVLNSIGEGILVADHSGKMILTNPAADRFHGGVPRQELGLQEISQTLGLYLPDKITLYPADELPLARAIRGESVDNAEIFVRTAAHPAGRWLLVTSRPRRDEKGEHQGGVVVFREITEQKQAEQRLTEHDRMLQLILNSIADGIMVADSSRKTLLMNPMIARMHKNVLESTPPEELPRVVGLYHADMTTLYEIDDLVLNRAIRGESVNDVEVHFRAPGEKEGRWLLSSGRPLLDENGRSHGGVISVRDITERKRAEAELRQANERTRQILESITDAFFAVDRDYRFVHVNQQAAALTRQVREEMLGKTICQVFPESLGTPFATETRRAMQEKTMVHFEQFYPPLEAWLDVNAYPSAEGLSIFFRDVTARHLAQQERESLVQELTEALANVKKLSGMLPICSECKKVRDDQGYWSQIEEYVRKHSEAQFSHGICPACMRSLYPEMAEQVESRLKRLKEDRKES